MGFEDFADALESIDYLIIINNYIYLLLDL